MANSLNKIDDRGLNTPIDLLDNEKIRFGTGNDLEVYHDGTNSLLNNNTGNIFIQNDSTTNANSNIYIRALEGEHSIYCADDGTVKLYYDGTEKLATTSTGSTVSGNLLIDTASAEINLKSGTSGETGAINWTFNTSDTNYSYINLPYDTRATDGLIVNGGSYSVSIKHAAEYNAKFIGDGAVELYYDNSKKFETTSNGGTLTGALTITGTLGSDNFICEGYIKVRDGEIIYVGEGNDLQIYHNGTNSYIDNHQGDLYIRGEDDHIVLQPVDGESAIVCDPNGAVNLYYDNFQSFNTKSNGIVLTGPESTDCNIDMYADDGDDNADHWRFVANVSGQFGLYNYASGSYEKSIFAHGDGNVELYHNNSKKLETITNGIRVTGESGAGTGVVQLVHSDGRKNSIGTHYASNAYDSRIEFGISDGSTNGGTNKVASISYAGISFGSDTAAENRLDDYEEGSHTATITIGSGTISTTHDNTLTYTKIGRVVHVVGRLYHTFSTTNVTTWQTSLPFACSSGGDAVESGNVIKVFRANEHTNEANTGTRAIRVESGNSYANMVFNTTSNGGDFGTTNPHIIFNLTYFAA